MAHVRALRHKAERDGMMCDGAESRDVRAVLGAAAALCRIMRDGLLECGWSVMVCEGAW